MNTDLRRLASVAAVLAGVAAACSGNTRLSQQAGPPEDAGAVETSTPDGAINAPDAPPPSSRELCPNGVSDGSIELRTPAQVRALAGCREAAVLTIAGPEIEDLSPLGSLERVGTLVVQDTVALKNLVGLSGLRAVRQLLLEDNAGLVSLSGLALHELTADPNYDPPHISLRRNPVLESLDGLQSLAAQPDLDITILDSPKLTNLDALSGFTSFGDLSFVRVTALTSLRALAAVTSLESLNLQEMHGVTTLAELGALTELGAMSADDCGLRSFAGLERIVYLKGLRVQRNAYLDASAGLDALTRVEGPAWFVENAALTTFSGLPRLEQVGELWLTKNPALASLSSLAALRLIDKSLTIVNNKALSNAAIPPWVSARSVGGRIKIDGNAGDPPHVTECPWAGDGECDDQYFLDLCPRALDLRDCCWENCG